MRRNPVVISVTCIVLLLIVTTCYFQNIASKYHTAAISKQYDMFSNNLLQTQFTTTGLHSSISHSPYVTHYPAGDYTLFTKPHILAYNKGSPWFIDADNGKNIKETNTTYFIGHVVIVQPATKLAPQTTITTAHGTVYSDRSLATTDTFVTIDRGTTHITAIGATVDFKNGIIQLLSNTRGYTIPQHQPPYYFSSDTLTYNSKEHTLTYTGHVKIDQVTTHITGDNLVVYLTPANKMKLAVDTGKQATYVSISKIAANTLHSRADTITDNPITHFIYLDGHAFVDQNHDTITAPHIVYDKLHNIALTHDSQQQPLTHIVIMPQKAPPPTVTTPIAH